MDEVIDSFKFVEKKKLHESAITSIELINPEERSSSATPTYLISCSTGTGLSFSKVVMIDIESGRVAGEFIAHKSKQFEGFLSLRYSSRLRKLFLAERKFKIMVLDVIPRTIDKNETLKFLGHYDCEDDRSTTWMGNILFLNEKSQHQLIVHFGWCRSRIGFKPGRISSKTIYLVEFGETSKDLLKYPPKISNFAVCTTGVSCVCFSRSDRKYLYYATGSMIEHEKEFFPIHKFNVETRKEEKVLHQYNTYIYTAIHSKLMNEDELLFCSCRHRKITIFKNDEIICNSVTTDEHIWCFEDLGKQYLLIGSGALSRGNIFLLDILNPSIRRDRPLKHFPLYS